MTEKQITVGKNTYTLKPLSAEDMLLLRPLAAPLIAELFSLGLELDEAYTVATNCAIVSRSLCCKAAGTPQKVLQGFTLDDIAEIVRQYNNGFEQTVECGFNEGFEQAGG